MSVWRFNNWIAETPPERQITLGEGNTPLLRSRSIGPQAGLNNLYFKLESSNPTGSYKDRFAAVAISGMLACGQRLCVATSSGNTGSALAAYCAAAKLECRIAIVETTPDGKLKQMLAYGAQLARVEGFGLDAAVTAGVMSLLAHQASALGAALQISAFHFSPIGMSGVQTISYELAEQLPNGADHVFCPAGGGGLTLAVARGFKLLVERGRIGRSPAVHCVQPAGNDTIAGPLRAGKRQAATVTCTSTISGLQVPNVVDGNEVIAACNDLGGMGHVIDDGEAYSAQRRLAIEEGVFCEPAGAVALAGVLSAVASRELDPQAAIVCLITGSGFKDAPSLDRMAATSALQKTDLASLVKWLGGPITAIADM